MLSFPILLENGTYAISGSEPTNVILLKLSLLQRHHQFSDTIYGIDKLSKVYST